MNAELLREKIEELLRANAYDQIENMLMEYQDITMYDNDLATVYCLISIYKMEKDAGRETILEKISSVSELLERYTILKLYLRRIDFGLIGGGLQDFYQYVVQKRVSSYELLLVMNYTVVHKTDVFESIREILQEID